MDWPKKTLVGFTAKEIRVLAGGMMQDLRDAVDNNIPEMLYEPGVIKFIDAYGAVKEMLDRMEPVYRAATELHDDNHNKKKGKKQ